MLPFLFIYGITDAVNNDISRLIDEGAKLHPESRFYFEYVSNITLLSDNAQAIQHAFGGFGDKDTGYFVPCTFKVEGNSSRLTAACACPSSCGGQLKVVKSFSYPGRSFR